MAAIQTQQRTALPVRGPNKTVVFYHWCSDKWLQNEGFLADCWWKHSVEICILSSCPLNTGSVFCFLGMSFRGERNPWSSSPWPSAGDPFGQRGRCLARMGKAIGTHQKQWTGVYLSGVFPLLQPSPSVLPVRLFRHANCPWQLCETCLSVIYVCLVSFKRVRYF